MDTEHPIQCQAQSEVLSLHADATWGRPGSSAEGSAPTWQAAHGCKGTAAMRRVRVWSGQCPEQGGAARTLPCASLSSDPCPERGGTAVRVQQEKMRRD